MHRVRALGALIIVAGLVAGVPWALITYIGNPWPAEGVALNAPLTDGAIIGLLAAVVWVLWAQLMVCLAAETVSAVRSRHDEIHVPGVLGVQQQAARALIGAIVVGVISVPASAIATSGPAEAAPVTSSTPSLTQHLLQTPKVTTTDHAGEEHTQDTRADKIDQQAARVTVQRGDTLWSIAQKHLGDGQKWRQIAEANQGREVADGVTFTSSSTIRPGWELVVPGTTADAGSSAEGDYTVKAGDTLSQIALDELGDAGEYQQVFDRSSKLDQAVPLSDPDLIYPGQHLQVHPVDEPTTPQRHEVEPHDQGDVEQNAPHAESDPVPEPAEQTPAPADSRDETKQSAHEETSAPAAADETTQVDQDAQDDDAAPLRTLGGIGALLAAGVVALLIRRRRRQQQKREPGQRMPATSADAQRLEVELRSVASMVGPDAIDTLLRSLAAHFAAQGEPLPVLKLARWTGKALELYLVDEADLPAPWEQIGGRAAWSSTLAVAADVEVDGLPAPYPTLVTVGVDDEGGAILVNLEEVGPFAVSASATVEAEVLAAAVIELGTAPWSAQTPLTVVGGWPELEEVLEPGRVRYVPDLDQYTPADELEIIVLAEEPDAYASAHLTGNEFGVALMHPGSTPEWRLDVEGGETGTLRPVGLPMAVQRISEKDYTLIAEALGTALRAPSGPVQPVTAPEPVERPQEPSETAQESSEVGDVPEGPLTVEQSPESGTASGEGQEISTTPYAGTVTLERPSQTATATDHVHVDVEDDHEAPVSVLPERAVQERRRFDVDELLRTGHPVLRLLGHKVELLGATGDVPSHLGVCLRMVTFLALHRGATRTQMVEAIWPAQRVTSNTVNPRVSQVRKWLGADEAGELYLPARSLVLDERIVTDWDLFVALAGDVSTAATVDLEKALTLVQARPLSGHAPNEFPFAEFAAQDMIAGVVDAAYELARRRFYEGNYRGVEEAAAIGVKYEPGHEPLWRIWIHAAHSAGNPPAVAEAIERVHARISELGFDLEDETVELIEALESRDLDAIEHTREAL